MGMTKEAIDRVMKELGIPMLPAGHQEYSVGPQCYFPKRVMSKPKKKNTFVNKMKTKSLKKNCES